jgi:hypothetical protein
MTWLIRISVIMIQAADVTQIRVFFALDTLRLNQLLPNVGGFRWFWGGSALIGFWKMKINKKQKIRALGSFTQVFILY